MKRFYAGQLSSSDIAAAQAVGPDVLLSTNVTLNVSQGSGSLSLTWPVAGSGFVLESSSTLGPGADWAPVDAPLAVFGTDNKIVMATTNKTMFFRLRR
jgi:hypothetical protein